MGKKLLGMRRAPPPQVGSGGHTAASSRATGCQKRGHMRPCGFLKSLTWNKRENHTVFSIRLMVASDE